MLYRKISTEIEAHFSGMTVLPIDIIYMPIYYIMCIEHAEIPDDNLFF
jgi:hypothetical protein